MRFRFQSMSKGEIVGVFVAAAFGGTIVGFSKGLNATFAAYLEGECFFLIAVYVFISVLLKRRQ